MITTPSSRGKNAALLIAGILMIATTLRVTFTGAAPLLDAIRADYGLSTAQTGLLTTLPLLAFALVSPLVTSDSDVWIKLSNRKQPGVRGNKREETLSGKA